MLGDGAHWIWNIADQHFSTATQIVDYFHAREHLADLTELRTPLLGDPEAFEQRQVEARTATTSAPDPAGVRGLLPGQGPRGQFPDPHDPWKTGVS